MVKESPTDLALLLEKQQKARQDEVFGALSKADQAEFEREIALENELQANGVGEKSSESGNGGQKLRLNKESETDTHQTLLSIRYERTTAK
jgi:hypothetical protein